MDVSAGSFAVAPPAMAHHGQEGFCLAGGGAPSGSSMTTDPCAVQIMTCNSVGARSAERWGSEKERKNGCAATAMATASSIKARNPADIRRMRSCIVLSQTEGNGNDITLGTFFEPDLTGNWDSMQIPRRSSMAAPRSTRQCASPVVLLGAPILLGACSLLREDATAP
jgi:hypothetical protein